MYGLCTIVFVFQGFWDSLRYLVGINGLPLIWDLLSVDCFLFCNTSLGGVFWLVLWLFCWSVWIVSSICLQWLSVCASVSTYMSTMARFLFAFRWYRQREFLFRVEGDRYFFLVAWLATSPIVSMGFSALIQINLHSTSACFRSSTNSTGKSIVVRY